MAYDAASNAALLATLAARAEGGQFTLTVTNPSPVAYVDHPRAAAVRPRGRALVMVGWAAKYRSRNTQVPAFGAIQGVGTPAVRFDLFAGVLRSFGPYVLPTGRVLDPYAESIVCDAAQQDLATGLLLQWAQDQFNWWDLRCNQNARTPLGRGP